MTKRNAWLTIGGVVLILISPLWTPFFGVYINEPGWYVAEIAAEKRKPSLCDGIFMLPWDVWSPGTTDQRHSCRHEYASLVHDPTVCEPILPDDYGWSCLFGGVEKNMCVLVGGNILKGTDFETPFEECADGSENVRNHPCCQVMLASRVRSVNDCTSLKGQTDFYNECLDGLAIKNADLSACERIMDDENLKTGCKIAVETVINHPDKCGPCEGIVDTIDDIRQSD